MDLPTTLDAEFVRKEAANWFQAITDPNSFLGSAFSPEDSKINAAISFFFAMIVVSTLFSVASGLGQKEGEKIDGAVNALLSSLIAALCAIAAHVPFVWLGGKATLSGTFVAYCYSAGPYMPLTAFAGLILLSGFPPELRPYASSPVAAQQAFIDATKDRNADKFNLYLGTFLVWGIMLKSTYAMFRALIFVHSLHGWKLWCAIFVYVLILGFIGKVTQRLSSLFMPSTPLPRPIAPAIPTASPPPASPDSAVIQALPPQDTKEN
ncbi:MAG: YIP1 family protein [Chthoniobacterales bacterium]